MSSIRTRPSVARRSESYRFISKALMREVARYLAAIEVFRAERCETTWLPESAPRPPVDEHVRVPAECAPSAY